MTNWRGDCWPSLSLGLLLGLLVVMTTAQKEVEIRVDKCTFPFTYNGKTYNFCTRDNSNFLWCSIKAVYDGGFYYCEDTAVKREEAKDDFGKVYELLNKNREALAELKKKQAAGECNCTERLSFIENVVNRIQLIVKAHEKRTQEIETRVKLLVGLREVYEEIRIYWVRIKKLLENEGKGLLELLDEKKEPVIIETSVFYRDCSRDSKSCYLFFKKEADLTTATKMCKDYDGSLLEVESQLENEWATSRTILYGRDSSWLIGVRKFGDVFKYLSGGILKYSQWQPGHPGNSTFHVYIVVTRPQKKVTEETEETEREAFWKLIQTDITEVETTITTKYEKKKEEIRKKRAKKTGCKVGGWVCKLYQRGLELRDEAKQLAEEMKQSILLERKLEKEMEEEIVTQRRRHIQTTECMKKMKTHMLRYRKTFHVDMVSTIEDFIYQLTEINRYEEEVQTNRGSDHIYKQLQNLSYLAKERIRQLISLNLPIDVWQILESYGLVKLAKNEADCVTIGPKGSPFWKDVSCARHNRFICKVAVQ